MKFQVTGEIAAKYPNTTIGMVWGTCPANDFASEELKSEYETELAEAEKIVRETFDRTPLAEHPRIVAWRKMFRSFGEDPTKKKSSAEALSKRIWKGDNLPRISALVDIYNLASVKHTLPMGGYDLAKIQGGIRIRFAKEGEQFTPLGPGEKETTNEGEVVYSDDLRVLTRKWNYRDCDECKIDGNTKRFVLFAEGAEEIEKSAVEEATAFLKNGLEKYAGATCKSAVCGAASAEAELE